MTQEVLLDEIAQARRALGEAEDQLREAVKNAAVAPRADKVELGEAGHAALSTLRAAKAKLADLSKRHTLAEIETAKTEIGRAERDLDRILRESATSDGVEKRWVDEGVAVALASLAAAKQRLADLENTIAADAR